MLARFWLILAAAFACTVAQPYPAVYAQDAAATPSDSHRELYVLMVESIDVETAAGPALEGMTEGFANDPTFAQFEQASPGLVDEIVAGMRPVVIDHVAAMRARFAPRILALLAKHLSPQEAEQAVQFYRSPLGKRMIAAVTHDPAQIPLLAKNLTERRTISTAADPDRDAAEAVIEGIRADLSEEERALLTRLVEEDSFLTALGEMQPQLAQMQQEAQVEPLSPEGMAAMQTLIGEVFARRFPKD